MSASRALTVNTTDEAIAWIRDHNSVPRLIVIRQDTADRVAQLAVRLKDITVVFDELDQLCAGKRWQSVAAREIVHYGRHLRIGVLGSFRRTQNVHEDLLSSADAVFLFRHSDGSVRDVDAVKDRFGERYAEIVTRLEDKQFVVWRDG